MEILGWSAEGLYSSRQSDESLALMGLQTMLNLK